MYSLLPPSLDSGYVPRLPPIGLHSVIGCETGGRGEGRESEAGEGGREGREGGRVRACETVGGGREGGRVRRGREGETGGRGEGRERERERERGWNDVAATSLPRGLSAAGLFYETHMWTF